jgi:hypothetical protein
MTGPAPAAAGQPARDDLTPRIFRALYQDFDLHHVDGAFVAVPAGTAWYAGRSIGEIARQISDPGPSGPATATPVPVPLPPRPVPVVTAAADPAACAQPAPAIQRTS